MKKIITKIREPKVLRVLLLVLAVLATIGGLIFYQVREGRVSIDDSLVAAPISTIAPTTAGPLTELDIYENERIKKGDPIAIIDGQTLYADTDGLVVMANNQMGSLVGPTNPVAQIINPVDMRIAGTIDENKGLSDIRIGQIASFTVDALPGQTFWGYVDEISPSAKQTTATFSISSERPTQQFVVYTRFDAEKYPAIKNGMSAKMTIFTNTQ